MESSKVEIFGRYYTIKGISDQQYLEKLATFVDSQMRNVVEMTGTVDTLKVAILAALTIADKYFKGQQQIRIDDEELENTLNTLSKQIKIALEPMDSGPEQ